MPYQAIDELPVGVKKRYSEKAQAAFMAAFNGVMKQTKDEARAFAAGHAAAGKVDGLKEVEVLDVETDHKFQAASFWYVGEFQEAPKYDEDSKTYRVPVTLIRPGLSRNKVQYSEGWLSKFATMMEGGKAYINHERKSEIKDRQSRSVNDVAGWYSNVHQSDDGSVKGILNLVETPATEHVIGLAKANPELMGLSINARGKASRGKVNGENAMIAETVEKVYSTDIVTEAAAGGEMESMRMAASVLLDVEEDMDNATTDNTESTLKEQTAWYQAVWLEAEKTYLKEQETMKATADWLIAEANHKATTAVDTHIWLDAKAKYEADVKSWLDAAMGEAVKELPEGFEIPEGSTVEQVTKFVEGMKKILPERIKGVKPEEPKKPGEEGYKRHFL